MKFHITITDNETGKVIHDVDVNAIVGGISISDTDVHGLAIARCNELDLAKAVLAAENATKNIKKKKGAKFKRFVRVLSRRTTTDEHDLSRK